VAPELDTVLQVGSRASEQLPPYLQVGKERVSSCVVLVGSCQVKPGHKDHSKNLLLDHKRLKYASNETIIQYLAVCV